MTNNISFFTAVEFEKKSFSQSILEKADNYFYLGGKKAYVIQGKIKEGRNKVVLVEKHSLLIIKIGKILSYFTIIIPLAMLIIKTSLRSVHAFRLIDLKKKLQKGVNISESTAAKIQQLIPKILKREDHEAIEWLSKGNNLVFRVKETPNFVYKMAFDNILIDRRFANMVKAKEVCLVNDLSLLTIPHATKFDVEVSGISYTLIAEESLDFDPNESAHEELYHKYSTELNETARQLAIFVAKTGFNDVTWRNIPIINEPPEFHGPKRVALIDLEHMNSAKNGFLGDFNGSRGLIRCVSEEHIDTIIVEARKQGVAISENEAKEAKDRRLKELADDKELRTLYIQNGVITGKELIQVDLDSLELNLTEESQISVIVRVKEGEIKWQKQTVTLRKVTEDVIAEMNKLIQNSSDQASTKGKRYFLLNTNYNPFAKYSKLEISSSKTLITKEEENQLWLNHIIQALISKGHIFKLDKVNGHGYFIQA